MHIITNRIKHWEIEKTLEQHIRLQSITENHSIEWGMNHIFFAPSKWIRPLLVYEAHALFGTPSPNSTGILASAVELLHTYSLVHDDLPCMDNDALRRGVPTLHTIRDEAYAVLAGDALLTRVFEMLSKYEGKGNVFSILAHIGNKAGYQGMIKGQILDLENEHTQKMNEKTLLDIHKHKTSALLELSLILGGLDAQASNEYIEMLQTLGQKIGLIFQVKDDILDITSHTEELGKTAGSDAVNQKLSAVSLWGLEKAQVKLEELGKEAHKLVQALPENDFFEHFLNYLMHRTK